MHSAYTVSSNDIGDIVCCALSGWRIEETIHKLLAFVYYPEFNKMIFDLKTDNEIIIEFITFALSFVCFKLFFEIRGPCALGYDFFLIEGCYVKNSYFFFGTASQFRNKR